MKIFTVKAKTLAKSNHWSPNRLLFEEFREEILKIFSCFNEENRTDYLKTIPKYALYKSIYLRKIHFLFVMEINNHDQFTFRYKINDYPFYTLKTLTLFEMFEVNNILNIMNEIVRDYE